MPEGFPWATPARETGDERPGEERRRSARRGLIGSPQLPAHGGAAEMPFPRVGVGVYSGFRRGGHKGHLRDARGLSLGYPRASARMRRWRPVGDARRTVRK